MVDCIGLENRHTETYQGFESLSLRVCFNITKDKRESPRLQSWDESATMRLRIYFGGASPNCGAGVRPYLIRRPALAHKNPTRFSRGSMSKGTHEE